MAYIKEDHDETVEYWKYKDVCCLSNQQFWQCKFWYQWTNRWVVCYRKPMKKHPEGNDSEWVRKSVSEEKVEFIDMVQIQLLFSYHGKNNFPHKKQICAYG